LTKVKKNSIILKGSKRAERLLFQTKNDENKTAMQNGGLYEKN